MPYKNGELASIYPLLGPNDYQVLGAEIIRRKQLMPTGDYTAFLIHPAYCHQEIKNEPESIELKGKIKSNYLYVFNRNLWTPKGVYVLMDEKAVGISQPLDENKLEKMLKGGKEKNGIIFNKDERLRFAPKGSYRFGEHTSESLSKDGFVIASYNVDGAKKLGEVSGIFQNSPMTFGLKISESQKVQQRVSVLSSYWNVLRLGLYGDGVGVDWSGFAFGVRRAKKF